MDPVTDPLDREIARALAVDPSPEFVARVRERIAEESSPASPGILWKFVGIAFATAGIIVALMLRPQPRVEPPDASSPLASSSTDAAIAAPRADRNRIRHAVTKDIAVRAASRSPAILVDQREARAIRAFMDGRRAVRIEPLPIAQTPAPAIMEPAPIREILIMPIDFGLTAGNPDKGVER